MFMEELPSNSRRIAPSATVGVLGILIGLVTIRSGFTITIDDFIIKNLPLGIAGCIILLIGLVSFAIWLPGAVRDLRARRHEQAEQERQQQSEQLQGDAGQDSHP